MKYGPLLVILLIFYLDGVSQDYEKHRFAAVDEPPVGNIKTMMEQKFSFTDKASVDSPVADRFLKVTAMKKHEFDKEKLSIVTQIYSVYDTNVVFSKHDLRFDAQGNNMRSDYSYASGSKGYIYTKLKRDAQGRVIEKRSYQSAPSFKENLIWLDMYKYDSRGNMLEDISYRGAEKIFSIRHTYTYDNNNNMLSQAVFVVTN